MSRRRWFGAAAAASAVAGAGYAFGGSFLRNLARLSELPDFARTPALRAHDPRTERRRLFVARGATPAENVDSVLVKAGGLPRFVGIDDVVLLKLSAQWWNQGMTNVAAAKRVIERVLDRPGFRGEVIVVENTHFRLRDGSGLSRAWTHPSERNVDVPGWTKLADLIAHFDALDAPVSFVGLVDAARSELASEAWHDPAHEYGIYGGDERGPIAPNEERDGYVWDFGEAFRRQRGLFSVAQTPLSWPIFTSRRTGVTVDFRAGLYERKNGKRIPIARKLTWLTLATVNEHDSTGITACCKSAMGIVDMSAGRLGTHPAAKDYQSVHYFGHPNARWRMAGPLAHFAARVRSPDLYLAVAEWVGVTPRSGGLGKEDVRLSERAAHRANTIVAGTDPVAIDQFCARELLRPVSSRRDLVDVDNPDSTASRFLRYYREVYGEGTLDPALIGVV